MGYLETIIIDGMAFALPIFIMAIGGIYSERSGITNLALEGLQGVGAFCGALAASILAKNCADGSAIPYIAAFVFAILGGALYAMLHALLCIKFKANQVISGVVINILATSVTVFLTKTLNRNLFGAASDKIVLGVSRRFTVPGLSEIPVLGAFFTNVYPFEVLIIVVAVIASFVLYKTRLGLHIRACGDNPHAVDAAGINVARTRFIAVLVSGALSGIAGMSFAYSIFSKFSADVFVGYGYIAIAALIFGNWNIGRTLFACLLFGFARSGGYALVQYLGMPSAYSDLVMTLPYILTLVLLIFMGKSNASPRALGEVYDSSKR